MIPEASIPDGLAFTFESQARQFPKVGPPGLRYERQMAEVATGRIGIDANGEIVTAVWEATVDCILYRNRKGHVIGILYHYPFDVPIVGEPGVEYDDEMLLERKGNVNLYVRPDRRRRGVGRRLLLEAMRRWPINFEQQRYTAAGRALALSVLAEVSA